MNEVFHISRPRLLTSIVGKDRDRLYSLVLNPRFMFHQALKTNLPGDIVVTAKYHGQIIGWGLLSSIDLGEPNKLIGFYVDPDYRERGVAHLIAQKLMFIVNKKNNYTLYFSKKIESIVRPLINNRTIYTNNTRFY